LHAAVAHVGAATGDPRAWTQGLTPQEVSLVGLVVAPPAEVSAVLNKIKGNHPTLFDPQSGAPVTPRPVPVPVPVDATGGQEGAGVTAVQKAEDDLAHQNSSTAQLDLLVVSAILNAHTTTEAGAAALRRLQAEIDDAVRTRTDLDTPTGARDFQRYLIGKLRQIGAVVETASLDDSSKAVLASAWTALYEASKVPNVPQRQPVPASSPAPARPLPAAPAAAAASPEPPLPLYGTDLGPDPLLDQLLAQDPLGAPVPAPPTAPAGALAPPMAPMMPSFPPPGSPPAGPPAGGGGLAGTSPPLPGAGVPTLEEPRLSRDDSGSLTLEELLAGAEPLEAAKSPEGGQDGEESDVDSDNDDDNDGEAEPDGEEKAVPESRQVRLPNGDIVTAPTPQLAKIISTAISGTPIGEAFQQHGLPIPPPGTAVPIPVDPAEVGTGDIGMFTDRQALALDRTRALLGGEVRTLAGVSGPSFLGWIHPPQADGTVPSTSSAPPTATADAPAPTRPSTTTDIGR
jgi:hypothetical protein